MLPCLFNFVRHNGKRRLASFYALNYPNHRLTLAWIQPLAENLELRSDLEWRQQEPNSLRQSERTATLASVSLRWATTFGWTFLAQVDNSLDEDLEEVPGVPGAPASASFRVIFA